MANDLERLERTEKLRQIMAADIARDLRTTLSNVVGYLEAISGDMIKTGMATIALLIEEVNLLLASQMTFNNSPR